MIKTERKKLLKRWQFSRIIRCIVAVVVIINSFLLFKNSLFELSEIYWIWLLKETIGIIGMVAGVILLDDTMNESLYLYKKRLSVKAR